MRFLIIFLICYQIPALADFNSRLTKYDQYFAKRNKLENVKKAVTGHEKLLELRPESIDLLWRLSMEYYFLGHKNKDQAQKIKYHTKGLNYGERCNKIAKGKRVECIFWQATNLALFLEAKGIFSIAFRIKEIIELYSKAEKLDPTFLGAGPLRLQSIFYHKAPSILGGDKNKSISYIKKAIKLAPKEALNYHFYIQYLLEQNKTAEARNVAKQAREIINPSEISFYESRGAFTDIIVFINTGKFTSE